MKQLTPKLQVITFASILSIVFIGVLPTLSQRIHRPHAGLVETTNQYGEILDGVSTEIPTTSTSTNIH